MGGSNETPRTQTAKQSPKVMKKATTTSPCRRETQEPTTPKHIPHQRIHSPQLRHRWIRPYRLHRRRQNAYRLHHSTTPNVRKHRTAPFLGADVNDDQDTTSNVIRGGLIGKTDKISPKETYRHGRSQVAHCLFKWRGKTDRMHRTK